MNLKKNFKEYWVFYVYGLIVLLFIFGFLTAQYIAGDNFYYGSSWRWQR